MRYAIVLDSRHPADRMVRSARTFTKAEPVVLAQAEMTLEIFHEPWLKITEVAEAPAPAETPPGGAKQPKQSKKPKKRKT